MSITIEEVKAAGLHGLPFTAPDWVPTVDLGVTFPKSGKSVNRGNEITPADAAESPSFFFCGDPDATYTVTCVDPDAPARILSFLLSPIAHGIQVNLKAGPDGVTDQGTALLKYGGPGPPPFTGFHRYVFLLYKNKTAEGVLPLEKQSTVKAQDVRARMKWDVQAFVRQNGLELIGMNWFVSKKR